MAIRKLTFENDHSKVPTETNLPKIAEFEAITSWIGFLSFSDNKSRNSECNLSYIPEIKKVVCRFFIPVFSEISVFFFLSLFFQNKICFRLQHKLWMENLVYKSICIKNFCNCFKTYRYFGWLHRQHILLILQLSKSFRNNELQLLRVLKVLRFTYWVALTNTNQTVYWLS